MQLEQWHSPSALVLDNDANEAVVNALKFVLLIAPSMNLGPALQQLPLLQY